MDSVEFQYTNLKHGSIAESGTGSFEESLDLDELTRHRVGCTSGHAQKQLKELKISPWRGFLWMLRLMRQVHSLLVVFH